ncbi:adenylate/guanylate cyclase domain-containing protein [Thiohalobacter sp. IOR34]|uniref:adenylate/guanylate cyclase domain-containing protein n=1 Tax=Thiohalobacter sp. IOR34 TaxID=3057176 RepID=UPI0025B2138E|nr:adenylate/guanylate cyclase domain-containing protein [Thiohalobacter sp. IOR34]WJW76241.1 adenylate/guanylate cyclase domain-containing protein [Thiohalobacter sp. IOR34]
MAESEKDSSVAEGPAPAARGRRLRLWPDHLPIAYKLSLAISLLMVTCIGLLAVLVVQHQHRVLRTQLDDLGHSLAAQLARSAAEPLLAGDQLALEVLVGSLVADENVLGTAVLDADGNVLAQAGLTPPRPPQRQGQPWESAADGALPVRQLISFGSPVRVRELVAGQAVITLDRATWDATMDSALRNLTGAGLLVLLLGIGITILLARRLSQPIYDLIDASQAIDQGSFDFHFGEHRKDELGNLMASFKRFAEGLAEKRQVEATLSRYLSPRLAHELLSNDKSRELGGQRVEASVLFADIVGFTGMAEGMEPEEVGTLLNLYFAHIAHASEQYHGLIDKYIGDCAMLLFGVPQTDPDHPFHAICCALTIQQLVERENRQRQAAGRPPVRFRMGINSGEMLAGNMGARQRMEYTVIGDAVNLASRLSSVAEAGQILIPEALYLRPEIHERVLAHRHHAVQLRGLSQPVTLYCVEGLAPAYRERFRQRVEQLWWQGLQRSA